MTRIVGYALTAAAGLTATWLALWWIALTIEAHNDIDWWTDAD